MSLAFWNNPLVVSAFRIKFLRGSPFGNTVKYLLLLAAGGALLEHYNNDLFRGTHWPRNYFLAMMGLQFLLSGLIAVSATSTSLRSEVTNRTLDMQSIASLSPRQILLGKLLGEPASAYLLAIATVPLGVFCWMWGGVSLEVLVLVYVSLASNTLLFGAAGLLMRLQAPAGGSGPRKAGPEVLVMFAVITSVFMVPVLILVGPRLVHVNWAAAVVGLFSSVPAFYAVVRGTPWEYTISLFNADVPALFLAPVGQLALAYLCFQSMVRQLMNPLNAPFGKGLAYVTLAAVDVLTAAVLYDSGPGSTQLHVRIGAFCLTHLFASHFLIVNTTPWRETLHSWVWRFRGRRPWLWDWWLGNRSDNGLALLTFCAIGLVNLVLFVLAPAARADGRQALQDAAPVLASATALLVVLTLTFGTLHQWLVFVAGRGGLGTMTTLIALVIAIPHVVGYYYELDWLLPFSPSYHINHWFVDARPVKELGPLVAEYGAMFLAAWLSLHQGLRQLERVVHRKLQEMGVRA